MSKRSASVPSTDTKHHHGQSDLSKCLLKFLNFLKFTVSSCPIKNNYTPKFLLIAQRLVSRLRRFHSSCRSFLDPS